ncbi:MAG: hypothetical protein AB7J13_15935 [Pyrinomonadaceae bacterium]
MPVSKDRTAANAQVRKSTTRFPAYIRAIAPREGRERTCNIMPRAEDRLEPTDLLVLIGENRHLDRIRDIVKKMGNSA